MARCLRRRARFVPVAVKIGDGSFLRPTPGQASHACLSPPNAARKPASQSTAVIAQFKTVSPMETAGAAESQEPTCRGNLEQGGP